MLHQKPLTKVRGSFFVSTVNVSRQIGTELEQHGHAAGLGTGTLSKPPIFRTKGAKSWPVLPLRRRDFWIILLTCILFCIFLFSRAKGGILTNYLFQFSRILAFCFLGEICHAVLPLPLPASIYGLLLLLVRRNVGLYFVQQLNLPLRFHKGRLSSLECTGKAAVLFGGQVEQQLPLFTSHYLPSFLALWRSAMRSLLLRIHCRN